MLKSNKPKRGRPATGRDPLISIRITSDLLSYIDRRASELVISRSELIRVMLEETSFGMPPGLIKSRTAYHEAGHAVIARVLRIPVSKVSIQFESAKRRRHASEGRVHYRSSSNVHHLSSIERHALIMMIAAGRLAEKILLHLDDKGGDEQDAIEIQKLARAGGLKSARVLRLRRITEMLVWRHAESIRRVAAHLLDKEVLDRARIDKIIKSSAKRASPNDAWTYSMGLGSDESVKYLT